MIRAGVKGHGRAEMYIAQVCLLADQMSTSPSVIHGTVKATDYRWTSRDRMLMLAWYQVKNEQQK